MNIQTIEAIANKFYNNYLELTTESENEVTISTNDCEDFNPTVGDIRCLVEALRTAEYKVDIHVTDHTAYAEVVTLSITSR
jgi:hypothetical protein